MGLPTCGGSWRQAGGRQWHVLLAALAAMLAGLAAIGSLAVATGIGRAADGVQFEKYWDDAGYEDMRPESVTFHLYREDAPETEVASTTLTAADAVLLEPDHWHGTFEGVPVDDGNGDPIAYVVKEDVPENYISSYDYGYDGYEVTFTSDSWVYSTFSLYLGYKDEAGDWWSAQIYEWSGGRIPATDDEVAIGGSYAVAPSNRSPYTQKNSDYISDEFMTKPGRLPRHDIKYLQKVYGNDCSRIRTMANWSVGYSEAWEYKANLGRHTPVMRINEDSVSWGLGNTHDWDRDGIHFQIESITPTRGNRGIEITDTINLRDFPVTKKWDDEGMEAYRPGSVTVDVYQDDGTEPYATKVIRSTDATDGNTWEATFESLPKYFDDGSYREHEYTLVERPVEGYSTEYDSEWYNGLEFEFGDDTMIGFNDFRSFRSPTKTVWQKENHRGPSWFIRSGETREGAQTVVSAATGLRYSLIGSDFMFYRLSAGTETWPTAVDYSPGFSVNNVRRVHIDREYVDWSGYDSGTMIQLFNGTHPTKTLVNIAEGTFYPVSKEEAEAENKCYYYKWDYSRPFAGADTITNRTMRSDIPFEKYWDDEGYEDRRPASATFHLYRESEPNKEIASATLTTDDAVAGEDDHWHGCFRGILLRDGEEASAFIVKEDVPEGYVASYDYGYKGYRVTFSEDSVIHDVYAFQVFLPDENGRWQKGWLCDGQGISSEEIPGTSLFRLVPVQDITLDSIAHSDYTHASIMQTMANMGQSFNVRYVEELYGSNFPASERSYEVGYSRIWEYRPNRGRHVLPMLFMIDSASWGWYSGPPNGIGFEVLDMQPIRGSDGRIEVTDTIDRRSFPFTKKWDDAGQEAFRPDEVTVDIYRDGSSEPYATKVVHAPSGGGDTWTGTFDDLPRFKPGTYEESEYTIVERPIEGYEVTYDSAYYNAIDVTLTEGTGIGLQDVYAIDQTGIARRVSHRGSGFSMITWGDDGDRHSKSNVAGKRLTMPGMEILASSSGGGSGYGPESLDVGIAGVRRVHMGTIPISPVDASTRERIRAALAGENGSLMEIPVGETGTRDADGYWIHYKWDDSRPFPGADTITNRTTKQSIPFDKYWDDEGYEDMRPSSVKFRLYRESEPDTEVASVTLTADDAVAGEDDHWHGEFGGIPMRDGEDAGAFVVKEDVPEGYVASYDYGYDGYNITFSDDTYLARGYGLRFAMQDADGKWRSDYLYEVTGEGISDSDYNYPARGPYEVSLSTLGTGDDTSNMESAFATLPDRYDIKYVTELCGDEYPRTPDEYECGYSQIWRYQGNLGKNMPVLWLVMDSVSYGWQGGPPRGYKFEVIDMEPVRNGPPRNEITNTVNKESLPFKKVWDDEGHESHRPSQVTVDLYQDGGAAPYATKTLKASSYPGDASVWEASFDNLPKYGDGYAEHEYVLRERPVAGYDTTYDSEYYNAIDVTFTGDTTAGANSLYAIGSEGDILDVQHYGPGWFTSCLAGRTFSFPGKEVFMGGSYGTIGISDVRRVHVPELSKNIQQVNGNWLRAIYDLSRGAATTYYYQYWDIPTGVDTGGQVPGGFYDAGCVHYKWDDTQPFVGADTIINTTRYADIDFRKIWEDGDDTGNRPSSTTFDLLGADGRVEKTVTLTAADADPDDTHVWRGSFGERLSTQPYSIRERPVSGYKTVYDSDDPRADVTVLTFEVNDEGLGSGADLNSEVRGEAVRTMFPNDSPTLPIYWDVHQAAHNDDRTISVRLLGSRAVAYLPSVSHFELRSVARTGHTDMVMAYGNPVSYSLQTRLDGIGESYGLIYTDGETLDSYDGQARPTYFLYEQTVPFTYCNVIRNIPARSIPIMKLCDKSGPAVGAKMGAFLQNDDGTETLAYQWVTEYENGQSPYHPVPLATGSYVIRELEAPHGYGYADEERIRVDVCNRFYREMDGTEHLWMNNAIGDTRPRDIMMTDKATGVSISKKGPDGDLLAGATLQVVASDGTVIHEFRSSSEQPEVLIAMLDAGKEYVLREKAVPDDSLAYARDVRFTVPKTGATADEPMSVEMVDEKVAVRISKKSVTGEDEIAGATLTLAEKGGGLVERWVSDGTAREFGDDKVTTGKTYVLHEEGAPDGYAYAADIEFVAGMAGSPDVVVMRDKPTHVEISKVAVTGGDELPGATLCVFDAAGDVVDKWVSGESPHVIEGILIAGGTYVLHEEAAPEGHEYAADIEFRVSEDGSVDRVEMVDEVSPAPVDQQQPGSDGEEGVGGTLGQPREEAADAAAAGGQGAAGPTGGTSTSSKSPLMQTGEAVAAGTLAVLTMSATALGVIRKTKEARRV